MFFQHHKYLSPRTCPSLDLSGPSASGQVLDPLWKPNLVGGGLVVLNSPAGDLVEEDLHRLDEDLDVHEQGVLLDVDEVEVQLGREVRGVLPVHLGVASEPGAH